MRGWSMWIRLRVAILVTKTEIIVKEPNMLGILGEKETVNWLHLLRGLLIGTRVFDLAAPDSSHDGR